jgi:hypothetical protein
MRAKVWDMDTTRTVSVVLSLLLSLTSFTILHLSAPTPQEVDVDNVGGMVIRLSFDKNYYYVGDLVTIYVEYRNINEYPVSFKPPSIFSIEYNYGKRPGEYPVVMSGWSVSPPELVGRSYTIAAYGVYHLTSFELDAERSGCLFVSYLGCVKSVRIMEK